MTDKLVEVIVAYNNLTNEQKALFKQVIGIEIKTITVPKIDNLPKPRTPRTPWQQNPWDKYINKEMYPWIHTPLILEDTQKTLHPLDIRY